MRDIRLVLFDLDGTFADTAPDLVNALNQVLLAHGRKPKPFDEIRPAVSHGGTAILQAGFGFGPERAEFDVLRQEFLAIYEANICRHTTLFPGMESLLRELKRREVRWGIVTNKPAWLTNPLMEGLGMVSAAACIVSGDTTQRSKPHPEPVLHACTLADVPPQRAVMVGDAERDIEAGRRAGTYTLAALFGYLSAADAPENWGADGLVNTPQEITDWLNYGA